MRQKLFDLVFSSEEFSNKELSPFIFNVLRMTSRRGQTGKTSSAQLVHRIWSFRIMARVLLFQQTRASHCPHHSLEQAMYTPVITSTKSGSHLKFPKSDFGRLPLSLMLHQGGTLRKASAFVGSASPDRDLPSRRTQETK